MSRVTRVRVLDLGSHLVKGLVADVTSDGAVRVVDARAIPLSGVARDLDAYLSSLEGPLAELAARTFRAGQTVDVVAGEGLVRTGVRRLVQPGGDALDRSIFQSRQQFVELHGTRDKTFSTSVVMRREARADATEVLVAHAYVRWLELETLRHRLSCAGLRLGRLMSRLSALDALCAAERALPDAPPATLVIDAGFATTALGLLKDGRIVRHGVVFAGALDLVGDESIEADGAPAASLPLDPGIPANFDTHRIVAYARAVKLAILELADWAAPTSRGDEVEDEDSETDALDASGEELAGNAPLLAHTDAHVTGGLATCPGFLEAAARELGIRLHLLDPARIATDGRKSASGPVTGVFGGTIGAARLAVSEEAAVADVAAEYTAALAEEAAPAAGRPSATRILAVAACLLLAVVASVGREWSARRAELTRLQARTEALQGELASEEKVRDKMAAVRLARRREDVADARLRHLDRMLASRLDWSRIFGDLHKANAAIKLSIAEVTFAAGVGEARSPELATTTASDASFELRGEAPVDNAERQVSALLEALKRTTSFAGCRSDRQLPEPSEECDFKQRRGHRMHRTFTLTGRMKLDDPAEN